MIDKYELFQADTKPKGISLAGYSAEKKIYHISEEDQTGNIFTPRLPINFMTDNQYEDDTTPRVCFSESIDGCLVGTRYKLETNIMYVHEPANYSTLITKKPTIDEVPEAEISEEVWVLSPVKMRCIGKIEIMEPLGIPLQYKYGDNTGEAYKWKWKYIK